MKVETIQNSQNNLNDKIHRNNEVRLPKNIRQIGPNDGDKRIYIEDYVMTYMKQIATKSYGNYQVAVLLGQVHMIEEEYNVFISGAVEVKDIVFDDDKIFGNEIWARIYEDIKKYFDDAEIVGWYVTRPGLMLEVSDYLYKIHVDNFAGNNKVLIMYDSIEREDAFYLFDEQTLWKQDGYYIYYEKNHAMQSYMIDHKDKESIEADFVDQTCINIRNVLERKSNEKIQRKRSLSVMYAAASVCAVFLIVAAVTMFFGRGVRDANKALEAGQQAKNKIGESQVPADGSDTTEVNVQPGNIGGIKGETVVGDRTAEDATGNDDAPDKKAEDTSKDVGVSIEDTDPITPDSGKKATQDTSNLDKKGEKKEASSKDTKKNATDAKSSQTKEASTRPKVYTIKRGDTLGAISLKYYHSKSYIKKIMEANNIENSDTIYAGKKIKLP